MYGHDYVYGIKIFLTSEASGEIGFGVCSGVKLAALRAEETQITFGVFGRNFKVFND